MENSFYVGQKVVCVDGDFGPNPNGYPQPRRNQVYVISEICDFTKKGYSLCLLFQELNTDDALCWWSAYKFRPIDYFPPAPLEEVAETTVQILQPLEL